MTAEYETLLGIEDKIVLQKTEGYAFTQDSVLLANLCSVKARDRVLELGSGCGVISILIALKKDCEHVTGLEIDSDYADMASRSAAADGLSGKIDFIIGDIRDSAKLVGVERFDKAVCNPPYFNAEGEGVAPKDCPSKRESGAALDDFVRAAERALRFGGEFFIVYKACKMVSLLCSLRAHGLEPKKILFVYPKLSSGVDTVIVSAKKGGKPGLVTETLIVMNEKGEYTDRIKEIYGG